MNNYYNQNKYQQRRWPTIGERVSGLFSVLLGTVFSTAFLSFCLFLALFSRYVTPKDIDYFRVYAKDKTHEMVQSAGVLANNASEFTSNIISEIAYKYDEYKENQKQEEIDLAKATPITPTQNVSADPLEVVFNSDTSAVTYFSQTDPRWNDTIYGSDNTIGIYGCGPTTVAMLASSLTDTIVYPDEVAKWAFDHGEFADNSGSYHSIIANGGAKYGLSVQSLITPGKFTLMDELKKGHLVVVLMDKGQFTSGGHFIILRGVNEEGEVLIADAKSLENSQTPWSFDTIISEAKYASSYGGPFWSISKK